MSTRDQAARVATPESRQPAPAGDKLRAPIAAAMAGAGTPGAPGSAGSGGSSTEFDVARVRLDFPILGTLVRGKPLVYLDNAATSQKPQPVIDAESAYYETTNANVHRGVHHLSERATVAYEGARARVQRFIGAADPSEIVLLRGTTEAVNLVAQSFARPRLRAGDEVVITAMEHHSNIVPWQMVCEQTGALLRVVPMNELGELRMEEFERMVNPRTRVVAVGHVSNALGTVNPIADIAAIAHRHDAVLFVDGAQSVPSFPVNVCTLGCDFYAFSGHKAYGPMGIGALYGRSPLLESMPPWQGGGDMIKSVTFTKTVYNDAPYRFEAGTPNVAGAVGLGAALDYLTALDLSRTLAHKERLLAAATEALESIPGIRVIGKAREKTAVVSFVMDGVHPHDIGTVLDHEGVAVRTGHHCAQPLMEFFGLPATVRASFAFYNTLAEVESLAQAVEKAARMFA